MIITHSEAILSAISASLIALTASGLGVALGCAAAWLMRSV